MSREKAEEKAREMLKLVGLDEELSDRSPFELSGGQMRRVAIAGVLAMEPEGLVTVPLCITISSSAYAAASSILWVTRIVVRFLCLWRL